MRTILLSASHTFLSIAWKKSNLIIAHTYTALEWYSAGSIQLNECCPLIVECTTYDRARCNLPEDFFTFRTRMNRSGLLSLKKIKSFFFRRTQAGHQYRARFRASIKLLNSENILSSLVFGSLLCVLDNNYWLIFPTFCSI